MRVARASAVIAMLALLTGCAWVDRSSVSSAPGRIEGNARSTLPSVSQSGRWVAFASDASNLVPGDTNGVTDVFVRDHVTNVTTRVSVTTDGRQRDLASTAPSISDDGRYVAFQSRIANPGSATKVFVWDRMLGATTWSDMATAPAVSVFSPVISGNGRYLAYLGDGCCNTGRLGPFVRDLTTGTTRTMPVDGGADFSFLWGTRPSLSDDGRRIAYSHLSASSTDDPIPFATVVADTATATVIATLDSGEIPRFIPGYFRFETAISGDGTKATYALTDGSARTDVFLYDLAQPGRTLVVEDLPDIRNLAISDDARRIGYFSGSNYYVINPDRTTSVVSTDIYGRAASAGVVSDLSGDGLWVAFSTGDPALVGDDRNGVEDVFLRSVRTFDTLATPYTCGHGVRPGPCDPP